MGPGHCGKSGTASWLTRRKKERIWIDCNIWRTDSSFILQLLEELSLVFGKQIAKNVVVKGDINFKELSREIRK